LAPGIGRGRRRGRRWFAGTARYDRRLQFQNVGADLCKLPEVLFVFVEIAAELFAQAFFQLMALVEMVNCFDRSVRGRSR
jgi:hypothetical protein